MAKKVYDMTDQERYTFEEELTFLQLDDLDEAEVKMLDQDVVREVVLEEDFYDIEDAIHYKEQYGIELNDEEEDYLNWADKVDADLGLPIMSSGFDY